jgi:hypothetical protein
MPKKRTLKSLSKELLDNPFFPLLFISEAVKLLVLDGLVYDTLLMAVLGGGSVLLWILSDAIDVDLDTDELVGDGGREQ